MTALTDKAGNVASLMVDVQYHARVRDWSAALHLMYEASEAFVDLLADVAQAAHDDGMTKRRIGELLDVSPRTFAGMTRTKPRTPTTTPTKGKP